MTEWKLDGIWQAEGRSPEGETLRFSGIVPGCVHTDLMRAGILPDLFWRDNNSCAQWVEAWDWEYRRCFDAPETKNAELIFEGLDTYAEVWLNGQLLGSCEDMFLRYRFPVEGLLRRYGNELRVCFSSPIAKTAGLPKLDGAFTTERLYTRRVQCTYSWDWVERFVTCGIWKSAVLRVPEEACLEHCYLYTRHVDAYGAQVALEATCTINNPDCFLTMQIIDPTGQCVLERSRRLVEQKLYESFELAQPQLWYPNGYGAASLYTMRLCICHGERVLQEKRIPFGIRTIRILQQPDAPDGEYAAKCRELKKGMHVSGANAKWDRNDIFSGFVVLVNGIPVMCKGACWVPSEPFLSEQKESKVCSILKLAKDAGVNMLRVWGGGCFEQDWFYDLCDKMGLLVTQDMLMACGTYPDWDEHFCTLLRQEAEEAALRLRNHPCLAWWSGDNENAVEADDSLAAYPGRRAVRGQIEPAIRQLDPMRDFFPSSPYNGVPYGSITVGTTHNTQFITDQFAYFRTQTLEDYHAFFDSFLARFVAEEPTMGAPMFCTLRRFMSEADIFGEDLSVWRYHTKNNPAEAFREFELFDYLLCISEKMLGSFTGPIDRIVKMQYAQYEWVRLTMELFRRSKGFSWGILYWMLNDCWPASGWSLIDYYGFPKAAYYALKRSAKGVIAAIEKKHGKYCVWICNDTLSAVSGMGRLRLCTPEGEQCGWDFAYRCGANVSQCVFEIPAGLAEQQLQANALLLCDLENDRTIYTERSPAFLRLPKPELCVERIGGSLLRITAKSFLYAVMLDGDCVFEENCFLMLPGEVREIGFTVETEKAKKIEVYIPGWNGVQTVDCG